MIWTGLHASGPRKIPLAVHGNVQPSDCRQALDQTAPCRAASRPDNLPHFYVRSGSHCSSNVFWIHSRRKRLANEGSKASWLRSEN